MAKLASFGITLTEVADAAHAALPIRGAGFIDSPGQRVLIQTPTPQPDIAALSQAVVTQRDGTPILLRERRAGENRTGACALATHWSWASLA